MDNITNYVGQPIFSQLLSLIDDASIHSVCKEHQADKYAKKLTFKDHLTTMLYTIFSGCTSIREVQTGLELCNGKLNHFDLKKVPARSTLSDGNKKRSSKVFGALYQKLYDRYKGIISDSPINKAISSKLYILDSTTISLFKAILKPAGRKRHDGKSKGGIKAHTLLKADCNMPSFIKFSAAALHDQQFYQYISVLPNGSIITFDKAYINYEQFEAFGQKEITYVVPQKENASYTHLYELELLDEEPFVLKDEMIQVEYKVDIEGVSVKKTLEVRRIAYYSQNHKTTFIYWTNNLELTAMQVVDIYACRWQIETFFKKLKQNFPLDYFLGDNENAIEIQIWCALIALVLLQVLYKENEASIAFTVLTSIVRLHLMNYIGLVSIIKQYKQKRTRVKKEPPKQPTKKRRHPHFMPELQF
jgi:Transposase DDE domain/Domain of unknown function (DUF4372)